MFRRKTKLLRADFPTEYPVRFYLRSEEVTDNVGWTALVKSAKPHFNVVVIDDGKTHWAYLRLVLFHEYAHCLTWDTEGSDHSISFARAYSRLYRHYIEQ